MHDAHLRDAHSVERWTTDDLRRRAVAGLPLDASEIVALLDSIEGLQCSLSIPPEFVVRVARDAHNVERWSASHPLLPFAPTTSHPADALALASSELRRALADRDWPPAAMGARRTEDRVDRALADAHANEDSDGAASLRWALSELDRVIAEAMDRRSHAMLRAQSESDPTARADLRDRNATTLRSAGVMASTSDWDTNGFGEADDVDLLLPCLVLAFDVAGPDDVKGLGFHADRTWHALHHCLTPRPMRTYRTAIVTPVATNPSAELALRRLASRCPTGRTIGVYRGFEALVAAELPGIDIDTIGDELSPAWIPLPMEALYELCAGTDDATVIPDELVTVDDGAWFGCPRPVLAYVTQRQGDEVW